MSFMSILNEETIRKVNEETRIVTFSIQTNRKDFYTILSGTMDQWHDAILTGCCLHTSWEFRSLMNGIYNIIIQAGFREAFPYKKTEHTDGTFSL